jgi:hypothetical protein
MTNIVLETYSQLWLMKADSSYTFWIVDYKIYDLENSWWGSWVIKR